MKPPKKDKRVRNSLFSFKYFIIMFFSVCLCSTRAIVIFVRHMDIKKDFDIFQHNVIMAAINVVALSLLFTALFTFYKHFQFQKPIEMILDTLAKIGKGDFSVRIHLGDRKGRLKTEYDVIADELNRMAKDLEGVETMRTDFISNVSHEMKTPLAVIQNYTTILHNKNISEEERTAAVNAIDTSVHSMSHMITNMLKLNKLENQQIFPDKMRYDLGEQLRECLLLFEHNWEEKNINIETDIPDDLYVVADRELTGLVWYNLLSNAFKFTPPGGTVSVKLVKKNSGMLITVGDTGVGISESGQEHIFEKFYQCDTAHTTRGNGLGLALVKRICDIFDYDIKVESELAKGTVFSVYIH